MKNTIVTGSLIVFSDGFVWKRLSNEKAYKIWVSAENEDFKLYKVRVDDESESLIESLEDLQDAFKQGHYVCIEVGKLPYSIDLNYLRNLQELSAEAVEYLTGLKGTWIKYSERSERWRKGEEERERIKLERLRKEEEARYKDFDEKLEEWKSGEINFLNTPFYIPGEKPNAWIRIKGNIIETSKQIKIGVAEARKLWRAVSAMHRGAEFRHGLVEDVTGHQWSLNRYENDLLTAGCHRIAYDEMERIAKQLGWA